MKISLLLFLFIPLTAFAEEPLFNVHGLLCHELDFRYINPKQPEDIEAIYCGYKAGEIRTQKIPHGGYGAYSTLENAETNFTIQLAKTKAICIDGQAKALQALEQKYPAFEINCSKYRNYDAIMNGKPIH